STSTSMPRWTPCSRCPWKSSNDTGAAAFDVCSARSLLPDFPVQMDFGIKVLLAYLLGSIVGSLVVGRLRGGVDIRKSGSGNAGATNALRTQGAAFAIWVIIIDIAKGWIAAA